LCTEGLQALSGIDDGRPAIEMDGDSYISARVVSHCLRGRMHRGLDGGLRVNTGDGWRRTLSFVLRHQLTQASAKIGRRGRSPGQKEKGSQQRAQGAHQCLAHLPISPYVIQ
jgi:hypothetical protein